MKNKWTVLAFLCVIFVVYTVVRAFPGLFALPMQKELGISDVAFGVINSAVFWAYAACVPFAGVIGDHFNRRKVIGLAVVFWSVMAVATGFAGGYWALFVLVSIGITGPQTLYSPSAHALISQCHRETRTIALSCHQAAYYTGWFLSGLIAAATLAWFDSWRAAYFIFGGLGIALGAVFLFFSRDAASARQAVAAADAPSVREAFGAFFRCPSAVLAALGYTSMVFAAFGYTAWGPKFVALKFGISPGAAGTGVMSWHFAAAFPAILVAGWLSDRLVKTWPRFRLCLQIATLLLIAPTFALFGFGGSLAVVWFAAFAYGVLRGTFEANQVASVFDVVDVRYRATALSCMNIFAGLIGSLAPMLVGALSQSRGIRGFEIGFALLGASLGLGAVLMGVSALFTFNRDRIRERA